MWFEAGRAMRRLALLVCALAACQPPGYGKAKRPDAATDAGATDGAHAGPDAAAPDAAAACDHAFRLDGHGTATSVWLTGDFVGWAGDPPHGAIPLALGVDGAWTGSHGFAAGTYQYKFIVDGTQWIPDPTDPNTAPDGFGGTNSVYTCSL